MVRVTDEWRWLPALMLLLTACSTEGSNPVPSATEPAPAGGLNAMALLNPADTVPAAPMAQAPLIPRQLPLERRAPLSLAQVQGAYQNRIAVKFREGSGLRPVMGELIVERSTSATASRQERRELDQVLATVPRVTFVRMHSTVSEAELTARKTSGEQATGEELPDLNLWTWLYAEVESDEALLNLINALNTLDVVEVAEPSFESVSAGLLGNDPQLLANAGHRSLPWPDAQLLAEQEAVATSGERTPPSLPERHVTVRALPGPTHALSGTETLNRTGTATQKTSIAAAGNYTSQQVYKGAAPTGVDTNYLNGNFYNSAGVNWGYSDIEFDWNIDHADLAAIRGATLINGARTGVLADRNHGTAVIGELSSTSNSFGTTGMVPDAAVKLSGAKDSAGNGVISAAINAAAGQYFPGAVILIEQQYTNIGVDCNGDGRKDGGDMTPVEYFEADRQAIKTATANGRIVVEAAGNGNCNLDSAGFNGQFATSAAKDSGAIFVGAAERDTRNRASFSNYGARVDVQSEGDWKVTTTGYGDLYQEGENNYYTSTFAGTSSASPIVTGAAVALSSTLWFYNGSYYHPKELRDLFRRDGTPQGTGVTGNIGRRPDMKKQISHMINRHLQIQSSDFDGDGRSDYATFRPSTGQWSIRYSRTGSTTVVSWGMQGDIPVPANMSGDARAELVVYRPSNGTWYIRNWDGTSRSVQWGVLGDHPVPVDWNGDGIAELTVYRPPAVGGTQYGTWYILASDGLTYTWVSWGEFGDCPLVGDFDGDRRADLAMFRGTTGMWYIYFGKGATGSYQWGAWGDIPLPTRSNGKHLLTIYRPGNNTFYWKDAVTGGNSSLTWGEPGDIPRVADTDGNGNDELMIWRPREGNWYNQGRATTTQYGVVGDIVMSR